MEPDTSNSDSPILNYDPARYPEYEDYIPVSFFVKGEARTLYIPSEMVNDGALFERRKAISRACNLYNRAYRMINPIKLEDQKAVETISDLVALAAAGVIMVNLWTIFSLKLADSEYPSALLKGDSDICPESHEEADTIFGNATSDRLMAQIKPELFNEIKSNYDATWFVWGHIFFSILYAMQRDHGTIDAIDPDRRESLFEQYKASEEFGTAYLRGAHLYGTEIARQWLTDKKPAEMSIESLAAFMDIELLTDASDDSHIAGFDLIAAQINKIISGMMSNSPDAPGKVFYNIKDGKLELNIKITAEATPSDLARFMAAAKAKQRIPRIPKETFLSEGKAAAESLARKGKRHLHKTDLADEMDRDREAVSNAANYYLDEWAEINAVFTEAKAWLERYKKP